MGTKYVIQFKSGEGALSPVVLHDLTTIYVSNTKMIQVIMGLIIMKFALWKLETITETIRLSENAYKVKFYIFSLKGNHKIK